MGPRRNPHNIEELLKRTALNEPAVDLSHRYELRRRLLTSRFLPCSKSWARRFPIFIPLVAGGALLGFFIFFAPLSSKPFSGSSANEIVFVKESIDEHSKILEFVDAREPIQMNQVIRFVPLEMPQVVLER